MLTDEEKQAVRRSWRLIVPIKETAADLFYRRLFELAPHYRWLFPADMDAQKQKLVATLAFIVKSMDWDPSLWREEVPEEDDLFLSILALGKRHVTNYQVPDKAYDTVGDALIWTLDQGLGQAFDEVTRRAWTKVYDIVSRIMKMGAAAVRLGSEVQALQWEAS